MSTKETQQWKEMLGRSFTPSQWWEKDEAKDDQQLEVRSMWVYRITESGKLYTVGFFDPQGHWNTDSDHSTKDEAAARVHWLNGGEK